MNDLTVVDNQQMMLSAENIRAQVNLVQQVMKSVMKKETHYGTIPGTSKDTLYKAGAEVLLTTFRIAVDPEVEDLSTPDQIRYRVHARGIHQGSGILVGVGIGECSSGEEKYKWRAAVCKEEFDATPEDRRRIKYKSYRGNVSQVEQVRVEPADIANTVLKMAKKRAQIDLTLTATAASDIFTQDVEDMPEELRDAVTDGNTPKKRDVQQPRSKKQGSGDVISPGQVKLIFAKLFNSTDSDIIEQFKTEWGEIEDLPASQINDALEWIKNK